MLEDHTIYAWAGDCEELATRREGLREMAAELDLLEDPRAIAAARATRDVLRLIDAVERASKPLERVWREMFRLDSHRTTGTTGLDEALGEFRQWPPPAPGEQQGAVQ